VLIIRWHYGNANEISEREARAHPAELKRGEGWRLSKLSVWREYVLGKKSSVSFSVFPFPNGIIARSLIRDQLPSGAPEYYAARGSRMRRNDRAASRDRAFLASPVATRRKFREASRSLSRSIGSSDVDSASRLGNPVGFPGGRLLGGRPETHRAIDIPAISRQLFARESADHVPMLKRV